MTEMATDHAILRYLERVEKIDVESMRKKCHEAWGHSSDGALVAFIDHSLFSLRHIRATLTKICERGVAIGAPRVRHGKHIYVLRNGKIVTILLKGMRMEPRA